MTNDESRRIVQERIDLCDVQGQKLQINEKESISFSKSRKSKLYAVLIFTSVSHLIETWCYVRAYQSEELNNF